MMAHIDEGTLQAYLDDEVGARADIEAHLSACGTCAAELERLRSASRLFASVFHNADVQAPALPAFAAVRRAHIQPIARPRVPRMPLTRAALLLFGFAAVASATIPGSPVRGWLAGALRGVGGLPDQPEPAAIVTDSPASAGAVEEGSDAAALSIEPVAGRIRIILTNVSPETNVRVRLIDGGRALVETSGEASRARFRTGPGRIELIGVGKGEVVVEIPAAVTDALVAADGKVLFERRW
ncbi:MAG: anti-sigma factor family protein [Gemmatimonadota bacterium]